MILENTILCFETWSTSYFKLSGKKNSFLSTFRGSRHQAQTESPYMAWWLNLFSASHNSFCCYRWVTHQWLHHSDPLLACLNLCTRGSWPWNASWRFRLQLLLIYPNLTRQAKQPVDEMQFKQMTCMLNRKCWLLEKVCGQVYMSIHTETYRLFWNTVRLKKLHWNFLMKGSERQFSPLSTPVHCAFSK